MINLPVLHEWDEALPKWMGEAKYQAVGWVYAIWQVFCTNALLFCLSYIPFLIRGYIFWNRQKPKRVMAVVKGYGRLAIGLAESVMEDYRPPSPLSYVPKPSELQINEDYRWLENYSGQTLPADWPDEWKVVEYKGFYYLTHIISLATLTINLGHIISDMPAFDVMYVKHHLPVNATTAVAMEISEQEAFDLIFSGEYGLWQDNQMNCIPTWMNYVDVDTKIWAVLASLPTLLQAANFNRLSFALSLVIMFLDVNRHFIYHVYDRLFLYFTNFVKEKVFKDQTGLYHFFSAFSSRWRYTDSRRKPSYKLNDRFFLHPHSKLRRMEDIVELEKGNRYAGPVQVTDDEFVGIRIWWEERLVVQVPFLGVIDLKKLLPGCMKNMVCRDEGGYRAIGCPTFADPFEFMATLVTPKPVLVE